MSLLLLLLLLLLEAFGGGGESTTKAANSMNQSIIRRAQRRAAAADASCAEPKRVESSCCGATCSPAWHTKWSGFNSNEAQEESHFERRLRLVFTFARGQPVQRPRDTPVAHAADAQRNQIATKVASSSSSLATATCCASYWPPAESGGRIIASLS